ncbi:hypothetical protein GCM10010449_38960 [Streptomyces rectiviolaceus]|uniref:Uncharacterized protein n=1 Tax=Streptomyces rectiviolaceus TaxID=332591 RepID=A0ABP6MGM5_9ACTN
MVVCYFQDEPYGRFRNFAQPCHSVFVNLVENGASWRWCCEPQVVVWVMRRCGKYVGDTPYLPVGDGQFPYPATLLDLHSKRLVGW